jgi:hypothetical protein
MKPDKSAEVDFGTFIRLHPASSGFIRLHPASSGFVSNFEFIRRAQTHRIATHRKAHIDASLLPMPFQKDVARQGALQAILAQQSDPETLRDWAEIVLTKEGHELLTRIAGMADRPPETIKTLGQVRALWDKGWTDRENLPFNEAVAQKVLAAPLNSRAHLQVYSLNPCRQVVWRRPRSCRSSSPRRRRWCVQPSTGCR